MQQQTTPGEEPERSRTEAGGPEDPARPDIVAALPETFRTTRAGLHALACYVLSPAHKARTGRIGLRPVDEGFGTPPLRDGSRVVVHGNRLGPQPGELFEITTLRAAAERLGVALSPDPGVGKDLPVYEPDVDLAVETSASLALGAWYELGQRTLDLLRDRVPTTSTAQLWPEHFDLAVTVALDGGRLVNAGFSAGDTFDPDPYAYVGPHKTEDLVGPYWNAPFGAALCHVDLVGDPDPVGRALSFIETGLDLLRAT